MGLSAAELNTIATYKKKTLKLQNKRLSDADLPLLIEALQKNDVVTNLILRTNQITSEGAKQLVASLPCIMRLDLAYNHLDDTCMLDLATSNQLELDLSWNNITDGGVQIFIDNLSGPQRVSVNGLSVSREKLDALGQKLKQLAEESGSSPMLMSDGLRLHENKKGSKGDDHYITKPRIPPLST